MYHKTVLDNGVRFVSEQFDHMRSVSLGIWVDTGSRDEDGVNNGISHFIEHMIFKGTKDRNSLQIAKELDIIGGLTNAFTGKDNTCFYSRVLGKHFTHLAGILSDIFLSSTFDPDDMERERQVILQEISMVEDTPDDNIHVLFNNLFWVDYPIGMPILGTEKTVSGIGRETILSHMDKFYAPDKILVAAAGDIDHESLISCLKPVFESVPEGDLVPGRSAPISNTGVAAHFKDLEQVHICLGGNAPSQKDEKRFACAILNTILGGNMSSRLFQEIRENLGLAYSVYSFSSSYVDAGLFGIYVGTSSLNVNPVLEAIKKEIEAIKKGGLSESDIAAAKEYLIGGICLSSEGPDPLMMRIAKNELVYKRHVPYEELFSKLNRVTVDAVIEVVHEIFQGDKISLATLGPFKEEDLDGTNLMFSI